MIDWSIRTRLRGLCGAVLLAAMAIAAAGEVLSAERDPVVSRILERGELVLGTAGSMPPLNMTTKDGAVIGMEIDIAKVMADSMGVRLRVETMAFAELLGALEAGRVDIVMSGMTITPRRNLRVAFVGPYIEAGKCFLTKLEEIATVEDPALIEMPELRVAALEGSTSQAFVREAMPDAALTTAASYDDLTRMVLEDEVHAALADSPLCAVALARYPDAGLVSIFTLLTYEPLGAALPATDAHFVNWTENFFGAIEGSGALESIRFKWLEGGGSWLEQLR